MDWDSIGTDSLPFRLFRGDVGSFSLDGVVFLCLREIWSLRPWRVYLSEWNFAFHRDIKVHELLLERPFPSLLWLHIKEWLSNGLHFCFVSFDGS